VEQARTVPQTQDTASLSEGSCEERLSRLRKLHQETDYSGMSSEDILHVIHSRFNEAFPDYWSMVGGFYNILGEDSIYNKIRWETHRQISEASGEQDLRLSDEAMRQKDVRRYIYGYDKGISDEELMAKLNERYRGGTLKDRCGMAWEMFHLGLIDHFAADAVLMQVQTELVKGTEGRYGDLFRDNPIRVNAMIAYGEGTPIGWTDLARNIYAERRTWRYESEELRQQELASLQEYLNRLLECLGMSKISLA